MTALLRTPSREHVMPREQTRGGRDFIPGYAGVIVRMDVKEEIVALATSLKMEGHLVVQRCLVTFLLRYALDNVDRSDSFHKGLMEALQRDLELTSGRRPG